MTSGAAHRDTSSPDHRDPSAEYSRDASLEVLADASMPAPCDVSPPGARDACRWCHRELSPASRRDAIYCSKACRQSAWRFGRFIQVATRAERPLRIRIADPPYPGLARRYYQHHPDYAGEVDHGELLSWLAEADGWALATSSRALPAILARCVAQDLQVRVASWHRGARPVRATSAIQAWEPVIYVPARATVMEAPPLDVLDYVSHPRLSDPDRVIGAKPAAWCVWVFSLTRALPGDILEDRYPGSGGVTRAWSIYCERAISAR